MVNLPEILIARKIPYHVEIMLQKEMSLKMPMNIFFVVILILFLFFLCHFDPQDPFSISLLFAHL